jgi:hypothetical protein
LTVSRSSATRSPGSRWRALGRSTIAAVPLWSISMRHTTTPIPRWRKSSRTTGRLLLRRCGPRIQRRSTPSVTGTLARNVPAAGRRATRVEVVEQRWPAHRTKAESRRLLEYFHAHTAMGTREVSVVRRLRDAGTVRHVFAVLAFARFPATGSGQGILRALRSLDEEEP